MDSRVRAITKEVSAYDRKLYAARNHKKQICIYRKSVRFLPFSFGEHTLLYSVDSPHLIFALTDTWNERGNSVDWGIEPIMARLRAYDLWNNPGFTEEYMKGLQKEEESKERALDNSIESYLLDYRRLFAKVGDEFNMASRKPLDPRKKKEITHGYR